MKLNQCLRAIFMSTLLLCVMLTGKDLNASISFTLHDVVYSTDFLIQTCGVWIQQYKNLHPILLNGTNLPHKKILYAYPLVTGIADRMLGIDTAFLHALMRDRAFQIGKRIDDLLIGLDEGFDARYIDWYRPKDEYLNDYLNYFEMPDYDTESDIDSFETVFVSVNRGESLKTLNESLRRDYLHLLGFTPWNSFGCISNFLFLPKFESFHKFESQIVRLLDKNVIKIGIQIRVGDHVLNNSRYGLPNIDEDRSEFKLEWYDNFFDCAIGIEQDILKEHNDRNRLLYPDSSLYLERVKTMFSGNNSHSRRAHDSASDKSSDDDETESGPVFSSHDKSPQVVWYLITDSRKLRRLALQKFGHDKIITNEHIKPEHSAKEHAKYLGTSHNVSIEGFRNSIAEWWLYGLCDYFVYSKYSGFGRTSYMRSLKPRRGFAVDVTPEDKSHCNCSLASYESIEDMSTAYSGI